MKKIATKRAILPFFLLFMMFYYTFEYVKIYYLNPKSTIKSPIDSKAFFNVDFVREAKATGYNIPQYFQTFFIVDLIFPLVYTILMLSINSLVRDQKKYHWLRKLIWAGMIADYLENFTFAFYLKSSGDGLAIVVATFTTIKTILFVVNMIISLLILFAYIVRTFRAQKAAEKSMTGQ